MGGGSVLLRKAIGFWPITYGQEYDPFSPLAIDIQIAENIGDNIHTSICRFSFSEMITLSSDIPDKNRLFTQTYMCK